jgi:hypothetical protein
VKPIRVLAVLAIFCSGAAAQSAAPVAKDGGSTSQAAEPAKSAPIDRDKESAIRKLLEVSGTETLMRDMMTGTMNSIRPLLTSSLPAGEYREKLVELFVKKFESKMDVGQLLTQLLPVYDQYFTTAEIEQLTQFYGTPLGKKYLAIAPQLLAAAQKIGKTWGEQLGRDSMIEVLAEHPDLQKALEGAATAPKN